MAMEEATDRVSKPGFQDDAVAIPAPSECTVQSRMTGGDRLPSTCGRNRTEPGALEKYESRTRERDRCELVMLIPSASGLCAVD